MKGLDLCLQVSVPGVKKFKIKQSVLCSSLQIFLVAIAFFYSHLSWSLQQYNPISTSIPIPANYTEMLLPSHQGRLSETAAFDKVRYPSAYQNMQFMAFRNPADGKIFYVQTKDPDGQVIDWQVTGSPGSFSLVLTIFSLSSTFPSGFYLTDNTMTAADQTDFYRKVANKYKSWAINQKWARRKFSKMDTMATAAIAPDITYETISSKIPPYIDPFGGQNSLCWITFWRKNSGTYARIDDGLPDYRQGGLPWSLSSLPLMNGKNCAPIPYMNALAWDSDIAYVANPQSQKQINMNEVWTNNVDARYSASNMIKDAQGQVASLEGISNLKYICQSSSTWKTNFMNASRTLAGDGWKGIYYDMGAFTAPKLCYDQNHGHDIADPLVWQNGIRDLLTTLKTDSATKDMLIVTEGNAEIYMDLVDAYLTYADTAKADTTISPWSKQVPLFREVYGEIARTISWQLFPENSSKTISDLTPAILKSATLKSADYGSLLYASPSFIGWDASASVGVQDKLVNDSSYSSLFNLIKSPQYKKVYERGAGAINWLNFGSAPTPVDVVDSETGTAAIQFGMSNRDTSGAYYQLDINEGNLSHISWDMKMDGSYYFLVTVAASDGYTYNLLYDQNARNFRVTSGGTLKIGLGADTANATWRTINRNLADDLYQATGLNLTQVVRILVMGKGLVDNVSLSNSPLISEEGSGAANWTVSGAGLSSTSATDSVVASQVVQFSGIADRDSGKYFGLTINDSSRFDIAWDLKTSMPYYVSILVDADDGNSYRLLYDQHSRDFYQTAGTYVKIGLGSDTTDGNWRSFRRNLADDLYQGAKVNITKVVSFNVYATASVDNIKLWGNGIRTSGR